MVPQPQQLIAKLQERIQKIQHEIARLESSIITATEEKKIHEEDLLFHLELLQELGGFQSEDDKLIELVNQEECSRIITCREKQEAMIKRGLGIWIGIWIGSKGKKVKKEKQDQSKRE